VNAVKRRRRELRFGRTKTDLPLLSLEIGQIGSGLRSESRCDLLLGKFLVGVLVNPECLILVLALGAPEERFTQIVTFDTPTLMTFSEADRDRRRMAAFDAVMAALTAGTSSD
jgi:hypothetical protein